MVQPIMHIMAMLVLSSLTTLAQPMAPQKSAKEVVDGFLRTVRSGLYPERAGDYMAEIILAHQLTAEKPTTIRRTPANYADHVKDFQRLFGDFELEITELLAEDNKVYVRWKQTGRHLAEIDGYAPTGLPLIEMTSVVYRVEQEKIVEYWLQTDRLGFELQLRQNKQTASTK
ncbi:ester cyclase [Spirosoma sp.]|uniref:ester cyclase n=1 Tax=Spirosoma sp. TaxID=1899569 RepID=UPI003B3BD00B